MASKIPFPMSVPGRAKKPAKVMKPEDEEVTPAQAASMKAIMDADSAKRAEESADEDAKQAYKVRGYKKGGMVRGTGCASKGYGRGKMY
jgi:hypothetical protein